MARPAPNTGSGLDNDAVAKYLLQNKFFLAALELHQELLEGNNGVHNVGVLNAFFSDPTNYAKLVASAAGEEEKNKKNGKLYFLEY